MNHLGLTFTIKKEHWHLIQGDFVNHTADMIKVLLINYTEDLKSCLITTENTKEGIPHYHVYIECTMINMSLVKEHWPYNTFIWCKPLGNVDHYINYITKYYTKEKVCYYNSTDKTSLLSTTIDHIRDQREKSSNKRTPIERFTGMSVQEYLNKNYF